MADDNKIIAELIVEGASEFKAQLQGAKKEVQSFETEQSELNNTLIQAKQKLKDLEDQGKKNTTEFKKLDKETKAVEISMQQQGKATTSLRTKQRQLLEVYADLRIKMEQLEAANLQGTESYKLLQDRMKQVKLESGALNDLMGDVSKEISQLGSDTQGIDKTLRGVTAVAGAFSATQGVMALFGTENESVEKSLLKVNAAMAIASGAQQFFTELRAKDTIFLGIQTKAQKLQNLIVGQGSFAFKALRVAMATVGFTLIISAIAILVKNFDKLKDFIFKVFPPLQKLGKNFDEIKNTIITFIKEGILILLNSFADLYNNSLLVRQAFAAIGATVKSTVQIIINNFKNVGTILGAVWQAIKSGGKNIKGIFTDAFKEIGERSKETAGKVVDNFANGFKNAKDSQLKKFTLDDLNFGGDKKGKEEGDKFAKEFVTEAKTGLQLLKDEVSKLELELEDLVSDKFINGKENADEIIKVSDEIKKLKKYIDSIEFTIEAVKVEFKEDKVPLQPTISDEDIEKVNNYLNKEVKIDADNSEFGKSITDRIINAVNKGKESVTKSLQDAKFGAGLVNIADKLGFNPDNFETRGQLMVAVASNIYQQIADIGNQIGNVIQQANQIRTQNELSDLEEKKNKGIISQKQYEREVAKVKNEAAKKQRRADIIQATAQIPMAVLSAFTGTQGGIIAKGIAAALAGAFAIAQVALIAKAPLPKFRDGGFTDRIFKGSGHVKGKSHEQGGVNAELEGNEYVMKAKAVSFYGKDFMKSINEMNYQPPALKSKDVYFKDDNNLISKIDLMTSYMKQNYKTIEKSNLLLSSIDQNTKTGKNARV